MDLVERYLAAVKFWLPAHLRDDVIAELRDDIRSQIEEAEHEKGHPLGEDEIADILKARGRPLYVASRFMPQRVLIGPELFPLYIFVLKIVAVVCFIPPAISWFVAMIWPPADPTMALALPLNGLLSSFAIVTIIFALIERKGVNPMKTDSWNPKTLRPVEDRAQIKRCSSVGDIIANLIPIGFFAAGYLSVTTYRFPGGHVSVAPEWIAYWQIIVVIAACEIALAARALFRPYWTWPKVLARAAIDIAKITAICWLLQHNVLRELVVPGLSPDVAAKVFFHASTELARNAVSLGSGLSALVAVIAAWRLIGMRGAVAPRAQHA